jgi:hypothetical protein
MGVLVGVSVDVKLGTGVEVGVDVDVGVVVTVGVGVNVGPKGRPALQPERMRITTTTQNFLITGFISIGFPPLSSAVPIPHHLNEYLIISQLPSCDQTLRISLTIL